MSEATRWWVWRAGIAAWLGVVTTVGVAWACAAWGKFKVGSWLSREASVAGKGVIYAEFRGFGVERVTSWLTPRLEDDAEPDRPPLAALPRAVSEAGEERAAWLERECDETAWRKVCWLDESCGWPAAAMASEIRLQPRTGEEVVRWGVPLQRTEPAGPWNERARALPLRPVWGGLLIGTALYGAGWMAVLAGPSGVRWWVRRVRGVCTGCGYDLKGIRERVCPECGRRLGGGGGTTSIPA